MAFNSFTYLFFFIIVFAVYYIIPKKLRYIWLLIASYCFYMGWNKKYAVLILGVSLTSYFAGILIDKYKKYKKILMITALLLCFGTLVYFKYINFLINNINAVISRMGNGRQLSPIDILLPIGISFFTFQAVGYVIDVYKESVEVEKNILRYLLFISFFPQLVAGPIERTKNIMPQLKTPHNIDAYRMCEGMLYIVIGLWQKIVIADNIALVVTPVYNSYYKYTGVEIIIATALFGFQIYCDFGGYTNIAIGSAKLLGIDLMNNFSSPYLATSVADFWRRWHISLTSWFTDYIYIPLGGNRKGKIRKYINTFIVFLISGIWHGAAWNYIFWGGLNGLFVVISDIKKAHVAGKTSKTLNVLKSVGTFALVDFAWLFFRNSSLSGSFKMIKQVFMNFGMKNALEGNLLKLFIDTRWEIIIISVVCLIILDVIKEKKTNAMEYILSQKGYIRWGIYLLISIMIVVFGVYGGGYEQTEFIYFQF